MLLRIDIMVLKIDSRDRNGNRNVRSNVLVRVLTFSCFR